jgi:hypothetical protein
MKKVFGIVVLLMFSVLNIAYADPGDIVAYGLIIGSNQPGQGQHFLKYAHNDAKDIESVLINFAGYRPDNLELLLDPDEWEVSGALDHFERVLAKHTARDEKTVFFFYYSGHARATALN